MKSKLPYSLKFHLIILFSALLLRVTASTPDTIRILFIGNSYTYAGTGEANPEIPLRLKEMGRLYRKNIQTGFVVKGGAMLERHWNEGKALEMIRTGKYHYVVLQDQSAATLRRLASFREYAAKFDQEIKKSGAKTVFYMTWGRADRPRMGDTIIYEYNRIAKDLGAMVAPCGLAWKCFFEKNPGIALHISDKSHPRREGVYLNTCVFYRTLFGDIPKRKLYTIKDSGTIIDGELAKKLQLAAKEAIVKNVEYGIDQRLNHNPYFQSPSANINHIIIYGQSLSTGQQTAPAISVANYGGNLMLGDQVWSNFSNNLDTSTLIFNPLVAKPTISSRKTNADVLADVKIDANNQLNCEPPVVGFANAAKFNFDRYFQNVADRKFAATSCGEGGRSIELLMKNCPNKGGKLYAHFQKATLKAAEAAKRMDKSINCSAILWMQGEYNYREQANQGWEVNTKATKDKLQYKTYFTTLVNDMFSDVKSAYNQTQPPVFITYQCGAQYTSGFDVPIGMAQLETANTNPRVVLAGPVYPVSDRGGHLCPNGSRWYGEMMAKVYFKTVIKGEKWEPLQPKEIVKGDNFIDIEFIVPEPPLRIDTLTLQKARNFGFGIREGGKDKNITSVTLVSANKVRLNVDSTFSAADIEINYAGPATAGNGNICDSDTFQSFATYQHLVAQGTTDQEKNRFIPKYEPLDGNGKIIYNQPYPLQNFSCAFYYVIPADKVKVKCK